MFEVLRMDWYRLRRQKYLLTGLLLGLGMIAFAYAFSTLLSDPETVNAMQAQGAEITAEDIADGAALAGYTLQKYMHQMLFAGGFWVSLVAVFTGVYCAEDYTGSAVKNIFSVLGCRWPYVVGRSLCLLLYNGVLMAAYLLVPLALSPVLVFSAVGGSWLDWLQMYLAACLVGWAISMCAFFLSTLLRREGWMVLFALLVGMGLPSVSLGAVCRLLHLPDLSRFTIFGCSQMVTPDFRPEQYLHIAVVCLAWVVVYGLLTHLSLTRRDQA